MSVVVFKTPGLLDFKAFTHFGVNAKPVTKSPIGYFGTGLKYATAVLLRTGHSITILRDDEEWKFKLDTDSFRDKQFEFIRCYRKRLFRTETIQLPFTTELGKDWELWQAFRELYSNTLDEEGVAYVMDSIDDVHKTPGYTEIVVEGEGFVTEFHNCDKIFLPNAKRVQTNSLRAEHFGQSSNYIYYRSMRVMTLEKPSKFTYNILAPIDLTEDRTAKNSYQVEQIIREYIIANEDEGMIKAVLRAPEGTYEQRLDFSSWHYVVPSKTFLAAGRDVRSPNTTVKTILETYAEKPEPEVLDPPYLKHLFQAIETGDYDLYGKLWNEHLDDLKEEVQTIEQVV